MPELIAVLTKDEIDKSVTRVAQKISSDFGDSELILAEDYRNLPGVYQLNL